MSLPDKERSSKQGGQSSPIPQDQSLQGGGLPAEQINVLTGFAGRLVEICSVVLDNVLSRPAAIQDGVLAATTREAIQAELSDTPHVAVEVRTTVSGGETYVSAILCPIEQAGQLLRLDLTPEVAADETAARDHLSAVAKTAGEIADLISLMLFTDTVHKAEIAAGSARFNALDETFAALGTAPEDPLYRLDYTLAVEGVAARLTHVLPQAFVTAIAEMLAAEPAPQARDAGGPAPLSAAFERPGAEGGDQVSVHPAQFTTFPTRGGEGKDQSLDLDLILDVTLRVTVELGRTVMSVQDVLQLGPGAVIELDKIAGEAVDILVNGRLIAKGEVVVVDENFGVRVTEIVSPRSRAAALR
jgi:flagellar motor switch protein FliN/FliY